MANNKENSKVVLANKIANQSKKVAKTYEHLEDYLIRIFRWFSSWIEKVLFNSKRSKLVSLLLAILIYLAVNIDSENSIFSTPLQSAKELNNQSITALYNEETFEISGLPESVDVTLVGDASVVNAAINAGGYVVADLEGFTEGSHTVKFKTQGYNDSVDVKINPSNAVITLRKKTTRQFDLGHDYINLDKMENIYSVGTPEFEYTKINVRASKETLDSISFVKALIDVSNQNSDFTKEAIIVAYDKSGQPVKADIIPNTVNVKVPVTSPSKTVPIIAEATGEIAEGLAIDSIKMDQETVTIYGSENVLKKIDQVVVTVDISTITKDSTVIRPITLPKGVNSASINKVTMDIKLQPSVTKVVDNVKINYKNNVKNYRFAPDNNVVTVSVEVTGSEANVNKITADDINVYFDMSNAVLGPQEFNLTVEQPSNSFVKYTLKETIYKGVVVGDNVDTPSPEKGTE